MTGNDYLNPFGMNNVRNVTPTASLAPAEVADNFNASIMVSNSNATLNYILSPSDLKEDDIELIKKELERKIQEQKEDLEKAKNTRGWVTSAWNGIKGWFGGGDKKVESSIANYEALLAGLNSDISNIDEVYKTIMGFDLDLASLQTLKGSEVIANSIDSQTQETIVAELENQLAVLEDSFKTAQNSNGWISGTWDKFKNWTGIGASSNKTSAEIEDLKEQIALLKNGEANLATTFKNITGQDLNYDNLLLLLSGEKDAGLASVSSAGQSVNAYCEGQKMCTDVVADMVSGIVAVGVVALGTAAGICAAPFTAGASLGLVAAGIGMAAGAGALVKTAIKASDCIGNEKTYSWKDAGYDVITGAFNGAAAPLTNALGGAAGTGMMKLLGQEAVETTVKSGALLLAKEAVEEGVEQVGKKVVSAGLARALSFGANSIVDGGLSGFVDSSSRALAEGRYEDIFSDGVEGLKYGLWTAPVMGVGFNFAGKLGFKLGQTAVGQATGNFIKTGMHALGDTVDNILPQGVKRIIQEGSEKLNNRFIQTSLKNCLTVSKDGIYSVAIGGYSVQLIEGELSEEILEAIANGNNTLVFNYANEVLTQELRKEELIQYHKQTIIQPNKNDISKIVTLDEKQYQQALAMVKNGTDISDITYAVDGLDPSLHSRTLDMIANGVRGYDIKFVKYLDSSLHSKALDMIEAGFKPSEIESLIMLDSTQYQKALTTLTGGVRYYDVSEAISFVDPSLQSRALDMLKDGANGMHIKNATKGLDLSLQPRALDMVAGGVNGFEIRKATNGLESSLHSRALDMIKNGIEGYDIGDAIEDLDPSLHSRVLDLLEKGLTSNVANSAVQIDENVYTKILAMLESGTSVKDINIALYDLDPSLHSRALDLLGSYNADTANLLAYAETSQHARVLNMLENNISIYNIKEAIKNLDPSLHSRALDMLAGGVDGFDIERAIKNLDPSLHSRILDLYERNIPNKLVAVQLDEKRYLKLFEAFQNINDISRLYDVNPLSTKYDLNSLSNAIDMYALLEQDGRFSIGEIRHMLFYIDGSANIQAKASMLELLRKEDMPNDVILNILGYWKTEIKQPITIKNKDIITKIVFEEQLFSEAKEILLCKALNIGSDIDFSKLTLKEKLTRIGVLQNAQKSEIFTTEEKNFLGVDKEIERLQKLIETVISVTPVSKEATQQMMSRFFANNNPQLDTLLSTTNFAKFGKEGLPLKYSRKAFVDDLTKTLSNVSEAEKSDILTKLGIILIDNSGYDGIIDLSKLSSEGAEGEVLSLAIKFIKENSVATGDSELDEALNSLIQGMPEFINIIGKQQHQTQDFSVDIHILTVLKESMSNPEYQNLSDSDKTCLKFATIFHDIAKSEGIVDDGHAEICALYTRDILRKISLPIELKDRIYELVNNHHWLAGYNTGKASEGATAALFRRTNDLKIAQIMAEADLKGVKADGSFYAQFADALEDVKQMPIQESIAKINQTGQMFLTSKIIDSRKIPTVLHNGVEYQVINFTDLAQGTDLQQYGFEPGATVDSLRLFIHMTNTPEITYTLNDPVNEGFLCASFVSIKEHPTYGGEKFGVSLEAEQVNIANAASENQGSGCGKDFSRFSNTIIGMDNISQYRRLVSDSIKDALCISDAEYAELFAQVQKYKYTSQLDNIAEIKIGEKTFTGSQIKEAILSADDLMMKDPETHNEANLYSPKVNAVVAKVDSLDNVPQHLLEFAQAHNLPIYLLGE